MKRMSNKINCINKYDESHKFRTNSKNMDLDSLDDVGNDKYYKSQKHCINAKNLYQDALYYVDNNECSKAKNIFKLAIKNYNYIPAMIEISKLYIHNNKYNKAEKYYQKSANLGDINSLYLLGELYRKYIKNEEKALEYYNRAANKNNFEAICVLRDFYISSYHNCSSDNNDYLKKARKLCLMAIKHNKGTSKDIDTYDQLFDVVVSNKNFIDSKYLNLKIFANSEFSKYKNEQYRKYIYVIITLLIFIIFFQNITTYIVNK